MKFLFLGDIVGKKGCEFVGSKLANLKKKYSVDFVIVNGENSADGNGITPFSADYLFNIGVDVITTGNHCFRRKEVMDYFEENDRIIRPANFPEGNVGKGYTIIDFGFSQVAVVNLMGTLYMESLDNPFTVIDNILKEIPTKNIIVDFHAEATSEKKALGHYLTKKVTAVIGTHTHVQTSDASILENHTAYITDAGMCGAESSVLGVKTELAIEKQRFHSPVKFSESTNTQFINGLVVEFDEKIGKSNYIESIIIR